MKVISLGKKSRLIHEMRIDSDCSAAHFFSFGLLSSCSTAALAWWYLLYFPGRPESLWHPDTEKCCLTNPSRLTNGVPGITHRAIMALQITKCVSRVEFIYSGIHKLKGYLPSKCYLSRKWKVIAWAAISQFTPKYSKWVPVYFLLQSKETLQVLCTANKGIIIVKLDSNLPELALMMWNRRDMSITQTQVIDDEIWWQLFS